MCRLSSLPGQLFLCCSLERTHVLTLLALSCEGHICFSPQQFPPGLQVRWFAWGVSAIWAHKDFQLVKCGIPYRKDFLLRINFSIKHTFALYLDRSMQDGGGFSEQARGSSSSGWGIQRHNTVQKWQGDGSEMFPTTKSDLLKTNDADGPATALPSCCPSVPLAGRRRRMLSLQGFTKILPYDCLATAKAVLHSRYNHYREGCCWPKVTANVFQQSRQILKYE